jgi:hypothetical protein
MRRGFFARLLDMLDFSKFLKKREPGPDLVHAELKRVLSSVTFQHVPRQRQLLQFIVDRSLAGLEDQLKGAHIAHEIFGGDDVAMRLEAGRLRKSLLEYFHVEAPTDPVRIDIPKKTYIAKFSRMSFLDDPTFERPARWHCIYCGSLAAPSNDYLCVQCGQARPFAGGRATMVYCKRCDNFSLGIALYCEWCGGCFNKGTGSKST